MLEQENSRLRQNTKKVLENLVFSRDFFLFPEGKWF